MEKRELVQKALNNQRTSRLACSIWRHVPDEMRDNAYVIEDQIRYVRESGVDFLKIMSDGYFAYPISGITCAADLRKLKPLPEDHVYFTGQIERAGKIFEQVGGTCMVFYNIFAAFSSLRFALGDERVMRYLKEDPVSVSYALDLIAEENAAAAERILKNGYSDGIYFCVQGGEENRFTVEEYKKRITPSDLRTLERLNACSEWNILHCCGYSGLKNHLESWREYPSKAVNWSVHTEGMGLIEGKKYFGQRAVIGGFRNTGNSVLYSGTEEQIRKRAEAFEEECMGEKGVILGADCSFDSRLNTKNVNILMEHLKRLRA